MALVRLASIDDYEQIDVQGRTMYQVRWSNQLCPGNPAADPESGLEEFNQWQCAIAAGHEELSPPRQLNAIIEWCVNADNQVGNRLIGLIVQAHRSSNNKITLEFDPSDYKEPELAYRYELAFLNREIASLSSGKILELRNIIFTE